MKTIKIQKVADGVDVDIKANIFSTIEQLDDKNFNTQFTAMQIIKDDNDIMKGAEIREQVYDWQQLRQVCVDNSFTLTVIDLNHLASGAGSVEITL